MNDISDYAHNEESGLQRKPVELANYERPTEEAPVDGMEQRYDEFAAQDWSEEPTTPAPQPQEPGLIAEYAPAVIAGACLGTFFALVKYFI